MEKCFARERLEVDWDNMMFFPYIRNEAKDIRKAKEIVKDFGYALKIYMPGSKNDDKDAEYKIVPAGRA